VRVVELHGADPGQPAEHAGSFRPVLPAELGHPQRQFPVAVRAGASSRPAFLWSNITVSSGFSGDRASAAKSPGALGPGAFD
jgi:hypothetical protein